MQTMYDTVGLKWGLVFCISNQPSGETDPAGPWTPLWVVRFSLTCFPVTSLIASLSTICFLHSSFTGFPAVQKTQQKCSLALGLCTSDSFYLECSCPRYYLTNILSSHICSDLTVSVSFVLTTWFTITTFTLLIPTLGSTHLKLFIWLLCSLFFVGLFCTALMTL